MFGGPVGLYMPARLMASCRGHGHGDYHGRSKCGARARAPSRPRLPRTGEGGCLKLDPPSKFCVGGRHFTSVSDRLHPVCVYLGALSAQYLVHVLHKYVFLSSLLLRWFSRFVLAYTCIVLVNMYTILDACTPSVLRRGEKPCSVMINRFNKRSLSCVTWHREVYRKGRYDTTCREVRIKDGCMNT